MTLLLTPSAFPPSSDPTAGRNPFLFSFFFLSLFSGVFNQTPKHLEQLMELEEDCNAESGNRVMETEAPHWINAREQHLGRLEVKTSPPPS